MRWRRPLLLVAVVYFTFIGGTFTTDHNFWPRVIHHALVTLMVAAWLVARLRRPSLRAGSALDAPLVAYFLANALATAFATDPRISLEFLWRLGVHIWLFYVAVGLFARGHGRDMLEVLYFTSAVVILVGVFEFASWYFGLSWVLPFQQGWPEIGGLGNPIPPRIHRLNFTLGFSTGLSAYLAALIPLGLAFALTGRQKDTRRGFWLWLAFALVVEGLSFSRGGLLSLAISLPTFALLAFAGDAQRRERLRVLSRDRRVLAAAGILVLLLVVFGLAWTTQYVASHRSGDMVRLTLWHSALLIFRDHPLTGAGPYGFGRALRSVRIPPIVTDRYLTADNRLLTTLAETGLPGMLALLWLGGRFIWIGYHRWRAASDDTQLRTGAAIAGVVGFGVHNLVDTFTATPILLPMLVLAAFVTTRRERTSERWPVPVRALVVSLLALVVLSGVGWSISDRAQWHYERSLQLAYRGDLSGGLRAIERAETLDPAIGLYAFQHAFLLGRLSADDPVYLDRAVDAYEDALAREETYDLHHANLSALYEQAGREEDARRAMEKAFAIQSFNVPYVLWLGEYAERAGDHGQAADWYATALQLRPGWAGSGYWRADAWREEFLSDQLALAAEAGRVKLLLAGGEAEAALRAAREAARPHSLASQLLLAESAWRTGDLDAAMTALDTGLALDRGSAQAYALRAEVHLALGDVEGADQDARTAIFLGGFGEARQRAGLVLAQLAEMADDLEAAEAGYLAAGPPIVVGQGWDVSVYGRKAGFRYLPQLQVPGDDPYAVEPWLALIELYEAQGRLDDVQIIRDAIRRYDPFYED